MERRRLMHEEVVRNQASREGFGLLDGFGDRETVFIQSFVLERCFTFLIDDWSQLDPSVKEKKIVSSH
eukprot:scaffold185_cov160-Ochromonas_danica.AAC.2